MSTVYKLSDHKLYMTDKLFTCRNHA